MLLNINDYGDVERDTFGFESFYEVKMMLDLWGKKSLQTGVKGLFSIVP